LFTSKLETYFFDREQVRVNGFGIILFFIFPGAFVDLCSDHLDVISSIRQLRIYCAGVWHNVILVLIALSMLKIHPYFVSYCFNQRAFVSDVVNNPSLEEIFQVDSAILSINNCMVTNEYTWYECLHKLDTEILKPVGYCLSIDDITNLAPSLNVLNSKDCCHSNETQSYCFKWTSSDMFKYSCLPARYVSNHNFCSSQTNGCLNDKTCAMPVSATNQTKFLKIVKDIGKPILYVGSIRELQYSSKTKSNNRYSNEFNF
jgi:S2P endopeptidase